MNYILHIYKSYYPETTGGVEQVIKQIVSNAPNDSYQHNLLTCTANKNYQQTVNGLNVSYYHQNINKASTPLSLSFFQNFKQHATKADILHFHYPWPFADLCYLLSQTNKPSIVTYHSDIIKQKYLKKLYLPLHHQFLKKVNLISPSSDNYLNTSNDLLSYKDKCHVIPLGIESNNRPVISAEIEKKYQSLFSKKFILFVGVLRYYKGLQYLIKAAQNIDCDIVIAGKGPMETDLKEQASKQGSTNVKFLGFISDEDKNALLSLCTAFVLPSHLRSEAFGICLLEAMQHSKPLITTEIGTGTSYVNQHKHTGFVVPPQDPQAIADAANTLLQNNEVCKKMGDNAFQRFQTTFTAKKMSQTYHDLYDKLLIT